MTLVKGSLAEVVEISGRKVTETLKRCGIERNELRIKMMVGS